MEETRAETKVNEAMDREKSLVLRLDRLHDKLEKQQAEREMYFVAMLKMLRLHIGEGDSEELVNIEVDVEKESFSDSVIASQFPEVQVTPQQELLHETVSIGDIDSELETKSTEHMSLVAISEEELIPPFQVSTSSLEPSLQFHNSSTVVCEDSQSVVGCADLYLFDHQEAVLVSYAKDESTSVTNNQVARQLFGRRSQAAERLELQKKRKDLKSWMFKYKQRKGRSWRLHTKVFSFPSLCDHLIDRMRTRMKRKLFGGIDIRKFGNLIVDGEAHEAPRYMTFPHEAKKISIAIKPWIFRFKTTKSDAGREQQTVYEQIRMVKEWLLQTSLVMQQVMRNKKFRLCKRWWFKYKSVEEGMKRLQIQLRYKHML
ncbi:PREDICTED: uncharacterized protein LOC104785449 [Camelina sativa]|uniref:Uncharacterized protein LOC104785449 n=1 Tax=Camelina sativa TaxID=90675 RepID=A0ABM0Z156_CAMSA|nr:PREDICTED: uncharacterized protein LOC104785449 [Camelina sativa]